MNTQTKTVNPFMAVLAVDAVLAESTATPKTGTKLVDTTPRKYFASADRKAKEAARQRARRAELKRAMLDSATDRITESRAAGTLLDAQQAIFNAAMALEGTRVAQRDVNPAVPVLGPMYPELEGKIRYTRTGQEVMDSVNHTFKGFSKTQGKVKVFDYSETRMARISENEAAYRNMNRAERSKANPLMSVRVLDRAENMHYSKVWFSASCPTDRTNGPLTATERLDVSRAKPVAGANVPVPTMGYSPISRDVLVRQSDGSQRIQRAVVRTTSYAVPLSVAAKSDAVAVSQIGAIDYDGTLNCKSASGVEKSSRKPAKSAPTTGLEIRCSVANGRRVFISHV